MKSDQKRRAIQMINAIKTRGSTVSLDAVAALLQELIDAEDRWKSKVKEAIGHAEPNERSVMVDGLAVFFSRADDCITDTHTLEPCPHCGGSGAAEDCKQAAGGPDGWQAELLDWASACQSAYHVDSTPGHRFGGLGSNLEENRAALIDYVEGLLSAAPEAPAVQPDQSEQHLEMVRDAERLNWALPFITGEDTQIANTRTILLANQLLTGKNGKAAIDAAIATEKGGE